jgi:hypothetical protein
MQRFVLANLSVLVLLALTTAAEASVQDGTLGLGLLGSIQSSDADREAAAAEGGQFRPDAGFCSIEMPRLAIDSCAGWVALGPQGKITLCDLTESPKLRRQTLPEPSTVAIWTLIGLCVGGLRCWRQRRGSPPDRLGWDRLPSQRRMSRPPWPDHVRARILEIIEKGGPH